MAPPEADGETSRRRLGGDLAAAALAAALSLAVAAMVFHLWSWHLSVPLSSSSDAYYYDGVVKGTLDHGWYLHNPDLGAPFGLDNHDFPVVSNDSLQLLIVKGIGLFTHRPFLVSNLFFLLTFPMNALGAFVALRWRRVGRDLAVVGAAAFGALPLAFLKGKDYLFFVSFAMVPLGCALVLTVLADEPLFRRRPGAVGRLLPWVSRRSVLVIVLCAAVASASVYYAAFTAILLATAAVARSAVSRRLRPLASGLVAVAAIGAFVVVNQMPTILYRLQHGPNPIVASRDPSETEYYGLKLIQMVLPVPGHRFAPFAALTDRYLASSKVLGEPTTAIGLLASVGLGWLLLVAAGSVLGSGRRALGSDEERNAAFCVVVAFLWATAGGLSAVVSYTLSPQLRAWGRMSVHIAFFSILGVLGLLERLRHRLRPIPVLFPVLLAAVFVAAALDQTSPRLTPDRRAIEAAYSSDADFVRRIESTMPSGSAILQLPYVAYPEVPSVNRLGVYDELRPYLVSTRLRWSYPAMKGRPEDWHGELRGLPLRSLLAGAVAGGMRGVVVDRFGYLDGGRAIAAELVGIVGPATVVDAAGRLAFWDLRPIEERLRSAGQPLDRLAEVTLHPVRLSWNESFSSEESQSGSRWRWTGSLGTVDVQNTSGQPRQVILTMTVKTGRAGSGAVTLRLPDGSVEDLAGQDPFGEVIRRTVSVPAGSSRLEVRSAADPAPVIAPDRRRLVVQLLDTTLVPVELCSAAAVLGAPDREGGCLETSTAQRP